MLWLLCEIAIAACDLAEVIGSAIALNLLFGLPLIWGVCLTALDVLIVLYLQHHGFRYVEALVVLLIVGDRRLFRGRALAGAAGPGGGVARRLRPDARDPARTRDALHRRSASSARR